MEILTLDQNDTVKSTQEIFDGTFGRLRDVAQAPDGSLYILTSNSGSTPNDQIIRVVPEFGPISVLVLAAAILSIVVFSKNGKLMVR